MSKIFTKPFNPIPWDAEPQDLTGDGNLGLSTSDTTQRYVTGTRSMSWNGSVYYYGKAGAVMVSYQRGAIHNDTGAGVSYEAIGAGSPAGSKSVTITQGSITEDQYQGGQLLLFHATGDGGLYLISGNDATSGTTTILHLDRPLPVAVTTSDNMELYANPWDDLRQSNGGGTRGIVGPPMAIIASGSYGWFQTRGVSFISPQSGVGGSYKAACYWRDDGSLDVGTSSGTVPITDQYAGYRMVGSAAGDGPLIMLQGAY